MPVSITMPALSPTMSEGKLATWLVKVGDPVAAGDVIAEIETDKATMEVEAVDEGVVATLLVAADTDNVAVGTVIALLAVEGEDPASIAEAGPGQVEAVESQPALEPAKAPVVAEAPSPAVPVPTPVSDAEAKGERVLTTRVLTTRVFATPLARRLAQERGLDLGAIKGSGPHGRIIKADLDRVPVVAAQPVMAAQPALGSADPFEGEHELQPLTSMRRTIAKRLSESKRDAPHFYLEVACQLDSLLDARVQLNRQEGVKVSVNDLLIKACAVALMQVPAANAAWAGDAIKLYKRADISVAVAIEGGLVTPVIRGAEALGLGSISAQMKQLAAKAREGKLMPEEYSGGSFSISNLGMFGVDSFQAVLNPPQACILAVGAGKPAPVVIDGQIKVATVMQACLSVDHRAVDGATAATWLKTFRELVENPMALLL